MIPFMRTDISQMIKWKWKHQNGIVVRICIQTLSCKLFFSKKKKSKKKGLDYSKLQTSVVTHQHAFNPLEWSTSMPAGYFRGQVLKEALKK